MVIAKEETQYVSRSFDSRGIFHQRFKKDVVLTIEHVSEALDFLMRLGFKGKYVNIFEFEGFANVNPEVRKWAAKVDNRGKNACADLIIINNLAQRITANFYLSVDKPETPTKVFPDVNKALEWSREKLLIDPLRMN